MINSKFISKGYIAFIVAILVGALSSPVVAETAKNKTTLAKVSSAPAVEQKTLTWVGCGISKKAFMTEMAEAYFKYSGVKIDLKGGGATRGIREVANRTRDLGGSCRQTLTDSVTLSTHPKERRVRMDPVAWDALVVIVHKENPVESITLKQIQKIYRGQITNWKQIGGNNAPIKLFIRKGKNSGVGRTIRELVFANYGQEFTKNATVVKSSGPLEKAIAAKAVNGIAITGISSAKKRDVKILKLDGKYPSYENIKNGKYMLYRPLYLVTHLQNMGPEIRKFIEFVHSVKGSEVIRKAGTVPYEDAVELWLNYLTRAQSARLSAVN